MRAWEFINEGIKRAEPITKNHKHPNKEQEAVMTGAFRMAGTNDKLIELGRIMRAVAASDGKTVPTIPDNWVGLNDTAHPYTKEEADMMRKAFQAVGIEWEDALSPNPDNKSVEPSGTYTKSPMKAFGGYTKSKKKDKKKKVKESRQIMEISNLRLEQLIAFTKQEKKNGFTRDQVYNHLKNLKYDPPDEKSLQYILNTVYQGQTPSQPQASKQSNPQVQTPSKSVTIQKSTSDQELKTKADALLQELGTRIKSWEFARKVLDGDAEIPELNKKSWFGTPKYNPMEKRDLQMNYAWDAYRALEASYKKLSSYCDTLDKNNYGDNPSVKRLKSAKDSFKNYLGNTNNFLSNIHDDWTNKKIEYFNQVRDEFVAQQEFNRRMDNYNNRRRYE